MDLFDMQASITRAWLNALEAGTRSAADVWLSASREGVEAWSRALSLGTHEPAGAAPMAWAWPWPGVGRDWQNWRWLSAAAPGYGASIDWLSLFGPMAWGRAWPMPMPAAWPWSPWRQSWSQPLAFGWPFMTWPAATAQTPEAALSDAMIAAYRSATGFAAAAVLASQPRTTSPRWTWDSTSWSWRIETR